MRGGIVVEAALQALDEFLTPTGSLCGALVFIAYFEESAQSIKRIRAELVKGAQQ